MQQFNYPTTIYYDEGALEALADTLKTRGHRWTDIHSEYPQRRQKDDQPLKSILMNAKRPIEFIRARDRWRTDAILAARTTNQTTQCHVLNQRQHDH